MKSLHSGKNPSPLALLDTQHLCSTLKSLGVETTYYVSDGFTNTQGTSHELLPLLYAPSWSLASSPVDSSCFRNPNSHLCPLGSMGSLSSTWKPARSLHHAQGSVPKHRSREITALVLCFLLSWGSQSCPAYDTVLKVVASHILPSFTIVCDRWFDPVTVTVP